MIANLVEDRTDPLLTALVLVEADAPNELLTALAGLPDSVSEADLQSNGCVVTTLQTALYHALTADSTREAIT